MSQDEIKLEVVAPPTGTAIKIRELQLRPSKSGENWALYCDDGLEIMEPRNNTDDLIFLNTGNYDFEIIKDEWNISCLRITKRG